MPSLFHADHELSSPHGIISAAVPHFLPENTARTG